MNHFLSSDNIRHILIEPTGYCNAKCPHCPRYSDDGFLLPYIPEQHLLPQALLQGLDPTKLINLRLVSFAGATGDPAMSHYIEELVDFFKFVPMVQMDTNGSLRSEKWWTDLARFGNLQVVWSIDGLEDTNHLYRVNTDYKKIMSNVQAYISSGGKAVWKCIIFKHNQDQISEITDLAKQMGFKQIRFVKAYEYRFQNKKTWPVMVDGIHLHDISPSDLSEEQISGYSRNFEDATNNSVPRKIDQSITCPWMSQGEIYINTLGEVFPCCMMTHETTNDYPGQAQLKNMVGGTFENISLHHNTLDDILKNRYGADFDQTLKNKDTMHTVCEKSCSGIIFNRTKSFTGHRESTVNGQ